TTGVDASEELVGIACKVITLTPFSRGGSFEGARKAAVHGDLLKDSPIEEVADAIPTVVNGRRAPDRELVDTIYSDDIKENPLTGRESEVHHLISKGKTTKEIAGE